MNKTKDDAYLLGMLTEGWSAYRPVTPLEKEAFKKVVNILDNVNYTPVAVATQKARGINYSFFCNAQAFPHSPNHQAVTVLIYEDERRIKHLRSVSLVSSR